MSKKDAKKGGGSGESDELELLKATCLAKELELFTIRDKMHRLEERSLLIENHIERLTTTSQEKIRSLNDIISLLNGYGKTKDGKIAQLEEDVKRLDMTLNETTVRLTKEMEASDNAHQFKYDALQLQMDAATVKLRELHEFNLRKKAVEEELARLKEQLIKEQAEYKEALGESERNSIAIQERLKKEIHTKVDETRQEMTKLMEEQLHAKTKKTILENEQLRNEVVYHSHQTMVLVKENEKVLTENQNLNRALILAKELEEDLTTRNHMYQKTTRILVYKLRVLGADKQLAIDQGKKTEQGKSDDEDLQEIMIRADRLKIPISVHDKKETMDVNLKAENEAIKFLYACLEDIELERATSMAQSMASSSRKLDLPLDHFNLEQRQEMLKRLVHRAESLREMTKKLVHHSPRPAPYTPRTLVHDEGSTFKIYVDDILSLPIGEIMKAGGSDDAPDLEIVEV
ncbi:unnamed protein product [Sphagnum jensenii]|uniref:Cilia- and flagella-associated protein 157 n=1 Tax=Sphagnum jensenii TaxID=128206 RepID=A0ABP0WXG0_9BRYO